MIVTGLSTVIVVLNPAYGLWISDNNFHSGKYSQMFVGRRNLAYQIFCEDYDENVAFIEYIYATNS